MSETKQKSFPLNYPDEAVRFIQLLALQKTPTIIGSQALRSQLYAGDYDLDELVQTEYKTDAPERLAKRLQSVVGGLLKTPNCYIGDIKCGEVPEWDVLAGVEYKAGGKIVGYDQEKALKTLRRIDWAAKTDYALLPKKLTPAIYFKALEAFKYHIVRWTAKELMAGEKTLEDGRRFTVAQGIATPSLTKIDLIGLVGTRYTEFSCIYLFENNGVSMNGFEISPQNELRESICYYKSVGNYFKVAKRMFSLARLKEDKMMITKLNDILNSDLGRLYSIISDANTLLFLLENSEVVPKEKVSAELEGFRTRLANIYTIGPVEKESVLKKLLEAAELPADAAGRDRLERAMKVLVGGFEEILARYAKRALSTVKLFPLPAGYQC
jgi:hypothetical protein